MPYEKTIFKHLFDDDISMIPKLNTTNYISDSNCSKYQNKLDTENKGLWKICFIYIVSSSALFFIMFIRDIWKNYNSYSLIITSTPSSPRYDANSAIVSFGSFQNLNDYKKNDDTNSSSAEMVTIPKIIIDNSNSNSSVTTDIIENPTFIKYYWYNSGFLSELIKTVEFIVLVGIFEYLFFAYIVNKFKIANSKTILCSIYKKIS